MNCSKCNIPLDPRVKFCPECGTPVQPHQAQSRPQQQPLQPGYGTQPGNALGGGVKATPAQECSKTNRRKQIRIVIAIFIGIIVLLPILGTGVYGAVHAEEWDRQNGNDSGKAFINTYVDGALASINHIFFGGFDRRQKVAWDTGKWSALWGNYNELDNIYTFAEEKALISEGKEKADELKYQRQQKIIQESVDRINSLYNPYYNALKEFEKAE